MTLWQKVRSKYWFTEQETGVYFTCNLSGEFKQVVFPGDLITIRILSRIPNMWATIKPNSRLFSPGIAVIKSLSNFKTFISKLAFVEEPAFRKQD